MRLSLPDIIHIMDNVITPTLTHAYVGGNTQWAAARVWVLTIWAVTMVERESSDHAI
jgi:hypothetical protein